MIKTMLTAAAALALTAGAAYTQQTTLGPQSTGANNTTAIQPVTPPTTGATGTMIANTPAGTAPATYPMCSHRGQDRCLQHRRYR